MSRTLFPLLALLLLPGCGTPSPAVEVATAAETTATAAPKTTATAPETPATAEAPPLSGPEQQAALRAEEAMKTLGSTLKAKLLSAVQEGGPVAAMEFCSANAQGMTAALAEEQGVLLGRSSLRLRNPANAGPDWVTAWLTEQGERPAEGVQGMTARATRGDGTAVVRALAPLPMGGPCLLCHGPAEGLAPELSAALAKRYPEDRATGYAAGDLRGAIWAEAPVTD